ncbi:alpha/beta hydrolase-fold protein [Maricaulis sp.]|uniref:alpha/beta hydrolase-fold protein n=1 Tax=Maricaulis sp. TaxID=1486257 RepID=UPI001B234569|nr:alpha/beta hydrolase-fold protein [Maricaulis sp.]MBO6796324.1 hypothetical protein [Maricaulis sp.]
MFVIVSGLLAMLALPSSLPAQPAPAAISSALAELELRPHAEEEIWRNLRSRGLPLIEDHPEDEGLRRVTFVIQVPHGTSRVRFDSVINAGMARQPVEDYLRDFTLPMQALGDTRIHHLTLDVPRDATAVYSFLIETPQGWRRLSDAANPAHLRGASAEAVLLADSATRHPAIMPIPFTLRFEPELLTVESAVLGRTVFLQHHTVGGAEADAPVLVLYDSFNWGVRAPAWEIVQHLVNAGAVPPMHVVLIDQLDTASARQDYDDQLIFLSEELPSALADAGIDGRRILAGASRRGLVASRTALERPQDVLGVISLSGSFYWSPDGQAPRWLTRRVPAARLDGPRFVLAAGSLEYVVTSTNAGHVMLDTNAAMMQALADAGHPAEFVLYQGGHDMAGWRQALAVSLERLFAED